MNAGLRDQLTEEEFALLRVQFIQATTSLLMIDCLLQGTRDEQSEMLRRPWTLHGEVVMLAERIRLLKEYVDSEAGGC